ncbi:hypothetical protein GCM10023332_22680 [Luteimonas vadosa]|uniref:30S ribosomal protein THX n=2 Tax=Luteimonas vadosa TaxID=1165507 RepID=A0ABP9E625_9GAMM
MALERPAAGEGASRVLGFAPRCALATAPAAEAGESRTRSNKMGKGDRKTAKGKRYNSSYGNARTQVTKKAAGSASAPVAKKAAAKTATKTSVRKTAKKAVAKKSVAKE